MNKILLPLSITLACSLNSFAGEQTSEPDKLVTKVENRWNLPLHTSEQQRNLWNSWIPYWETESGTMPGPNDYEQWLAKREEKANDPLVARFNKAALEYADVEIKEVYINGVRTLEITPSNLEHNNSVILFSHPGGMYAHKPETVLTDAAPMAMTAKTKVISIDYRKIPGPPKGLKIQDQRDDVISVYKGVVEKLGYKPKNVGMYGCSAGSVLTVQAVNKLSHDKYPLPGAIAPNAGLYDWTLQGDTWYTMEGKDPVMSKPHYAEPIIAMAKMDPSNPEISPALDNFDGREWPPTMLFVGGREMLLSDSMMLNQKLKQAGHDSEINPFDGMVHCWNVVFYTPEAIAMRKQLVGFMKEKGVFDSEN